MKMKMKMKMCDACATSVYRKHLFLIFVIFELISVGCTLSLFVFFNKQKKVF